MERYLLSIARSVNKLGILLTKIVKIKDSIKMKTKNNRYQFDKKNHLHLLDGQPLTGTSSVSSVIAKPLTWYASGLAVKEFGCPDPKVLTKIKNRKVTSEERDELRKSLFSKLEEIKKMTPDDYLKLIDRAYRAHDTNLRNKAEEGTDLHAELERFVRDEMNGEMRLPEAYHERIRGFVSWARANVKKWLWSEAHCYSEKHWLGGISDAGYIGNNGEVILMDFKSSREAYLTQFWQCAGYDIQISENGLLTPNGDQISEPITGFNRYAIVPFGMERPTPQFFEDIAGAKEAFLAEVLLYRKMPRD